MTGGHLTLLHSERPKLKMKIFNDRWSLNPIALRKAKIVYNFGLSECNRVKIENENNNMKTLTAEISTMGLESLEFRSYEN